MPETDPKTLILQKNFQKDFLYRFCLVVMTLLYDGNFGSFIKDAEAVDPYSAYSEIFNRRNIFQLPETEDTAVNEEEPLPEFYKLMGVILDETPSAILLDTQTQKTVLVRRGDVLSGGVVSEIKINEVVLSVGKRAVSITLQNY